MNGHSGRLEEVRAAIFASKQARHRVDANASPEEKFPTLEAMHELARERIRARKTPRPVTGPK